MHSRDVLSIASTSRGATQNQPFAKIHDDILILILEKLEWIDRIRGSAVCKKWLQEITKIPYLSQGKFPWLFSCKLYDTLAGCKAKLTEFGSSKRSYRTESGQHLYGASICASKFGWILMMRSQERKFPNLKYIHNKFFVYCPFNYKLINLPSFNTPSNHTTRYYTISSNIPTLPDCVFFATRASFHRMIIEIRTCRIGDNKWKTYKINLNIPYVEFAVECINGLLYVVLLRNNAPDVESDPILNSHVGTFDPQSNEWKLIKNEEGFTMSNGKKVEAPIRQWRVSPVLYNNEELYIVRQIAHRGVWDFFKYDMEGNQWVELPSLGNRVLFRCVSSFLVDAVGKLSNLGNLVFFGYGGSTCYPYSVSSRKIDYDCEHYIDDKGFEDSKFYQRAWIIPTV